MLSRFITPASSASGGDGSDETLIEPTGVGPTRARPTTSTPASRRARRNAPVVKSAGSGTTNPYTRVWEDEPIHPLTRITPSSPPVTVTWAPRLFARVVAALLTVNAVVAGSSLTAPACPARPGVTTT